jgi:hypothetical protein
MNYDIPLRYLARIWFTEPPKLVGPKSFARISTLLDAELDVASTIRLDVQGGVGSSATVLLSKETGWQLVAGLDSIDLEQHGGLTRSMSFPAFLNKAGEVLSFVTSTAKVSAHRVASVSEGFLGEMPEPARDDIARRLLRFPPSFEPAPYEWDWRCVQRTRRTFAGLSEQTNTIAIAKRMSGQLAAVGGVPVTFDRIRLDVDINTDATDASPRFTAKHVEGYFTNAVGWHEQLDQELTSFLGVGGRT